MIPGASDMTVLRAIVCSPQITKNGILKQAETSNTRFFTVLKKLKKQGLVEAQEDAGTPPSAGQLPRKLYTATIKGVEALKESLQQPPSQPLNCVRDNPYRLQLASEAALLATGLHASITSDHFKAQLSLEGNHQLDVEVTGVLLRSPGGYILHGRAIDAASDFRALVRASAPFDPRPEFDIVMGRVRFSEDLTI